MHDEANKNQYEVSAVERTTLQRVCQAITGIAMLFKRANRSSIAKKPAL